MATAQHEDARTLDDLVRAGYTRYLGTSSFASSRSQAACSSAVPRAGGRVAP
jgi:aryl-alcohol dehydrogenase-like predicted oxidoreductase